MEVAVDIVGVFEVENAENPFVLLRDSAGRSFPIWVGPCEAMAIQFALSGAMLSRPLTHDLMLSLLERVGATLQRVLIDDLSNQVFYAKLFLSTPGGELSVDSRPSDALALAVRAQVPVLVAEAVIQEAMLDQEITIQEEPPWEEGESPEGDEAPPPEA